MDTYADIMGVRVVARNRSGMAIAYHAGVRMVASR